MPAEGRSMRENILEAAVQLFAEYGYHAAPLRDIARLAGIQAASIYHHYPNKQSLLVEIMETHMRRLNSQLESILRKYDDPRERLRESIANHIRLHTTYKAEFFIIDTELRSLEEEQRARVIALRDEYDSLLQGLLYDGMERGIFRQSDTKVTTYAIIAMCTQVSSWFRSGGRLSVQQVIEIYYQMISQGLLLYPEGARMQGEAVRTLPPSSALGD